MAYNEFGGAFFDDLCELLVDARLHVDSVGGDASLACVPPFQEHEGVGGLVEVCVVED